MGLVARRNRSTEQALAHFERTLEILDAAGSLTPLTAVDRFDMAHALRQIGLTQMNQQRLPAAQATFERAIPIVERVMGDDPDNFIWPTERTIFRSLIATVQGARGQAATALATWKAARSEFRALAADRPGDDKVWNLYLSSTIEVSRLQRETGALNPAEAQLRELLTELQRRLHATPKAANLQRKRITVLHALGLVYRARARLPDTTGADRRTELEEALNHLRQSSTAIGALIQQGGAARNARPYFDEVRRDTKGCEAELGKLGSGS